MNSLKRVGLGLLALLLLLSTACNSEGLRNAAKDQRPTPVNERPVIEEAVVGGCFISLKLRANSNLKRLAREIDATSPDPHDLATAIAEPYRRHLSHDQISQFISACVHGIREAVKSDSGLKSSEFIRDWKEACRFQASVDKTLEFTARSFDAESSSTKDVAEAWTDQLLHEHKNYPKQLLVSSCARGLREEAS